jgi:imidazolonepropionase-like amidohydrolase
VAHEAGLTVTAHSYGDEGDWAAIRGGVDGIEHLVNVPHSLTRLLMRQDRAMERWESWYEHGLANTRKLHQAGVRLIFGTDTPFAFGNFFHSVMNEVRALKLSGLSNDSILRMATSEAASVLGLSDRIGTIAPGKVADVVLVDGDPLSDIDALGRVALVVKEGRVVYRK